MHECPVCQMDCDCDGDDLWYDEAPDECEHDCDDDDAVVFEFGDGDDDG